MLTNVFRNIVGRQLRAIERVAGSDEKRRSWSCGVWGYLHSSKHVHQSSHEYYCTTLSSDGREGEAYKFLADYHEHAHIWATCLRSTNGR